MDGFISILVRHLHHNLLLFFFFSFQRFPAFSAVISFPLFFSSLSQIHQDVIWSERTHGDEHYTAFITVPLTSCFSSSCTDAAAGTGPDKAEGREPHSSRCDRPTEKTQSGLAWSDIGGWGERRNTFIHTLCTAGLWSCMSHCTAECKRDANRVTLNSTEIRRSPESVSPSVIVRSCLEENENLLQHTVWEYFINELIAFRFTLRCFHIQNVNVNHDRSF